MKNNKSKSEAADRFTDAQLAEVPRVALERGFHAFIDETSMTDHARRTIYLDEDAPNGGLDILVFDNECV